MCASRIVVIEVVEREARWVGRRAEKKGTTAAESGVSSGKSGQIKNRHHSICGRKRVARKRCRGGDKDTMKGEKKKSWCSFCTKFTK